MPSHADLGACSRCQQVHCIEGVASETGALHLVCYHHGVQVETAVRAKVCTDCGYVEFWVRSPKSLKLRPERIDAAQAEQAAAVTHADW
jgi:hypothetical protein